MKVLGAEIVLPEGLIEEEKNWFTDGSTTVVVKHVSEVTATVFCTVDPEKGFISRVLNQYDRNFLQVPRSVDREFCSARAYRLAVEYLVCDNGLFTSKIIFGFTNNFTKINPSIVNIYDVIGYIENDEAYMLFMMADLKGNCKGVTITMDDIRNSLKVYSVKATSEL